jgi:GTP-binding protein
VKIKNISFYKGVSINDSKVYFDEKKEIIFVWRSNVWKSSLMNALLNKKDLVKTSSKPWKTRNANLFLLNNKYYFTDLPWYWFAKLWKQLKEDLDSLISWYVWERRNYIKKVVLILDSKIWPQQKDIDMFKYITDLWLPILIVLSKIDRLNKNGINKSILHCEKVFFWQQILAVSATKKLWIRKVFKKLTDSLVQKD